MNTKFQYDENGVPRISKKKIESLAAEVCRWFDNEILLVPTSVDIWKIYIKLAEKKSFVFLYEDLNPSQNENRILGKFCYGTPPRIILDQKHEESDSSMRVRFTLAHELGHFVLHRHRKIKNTEVLIDTEEELPRYFITPKNNRNWVEWQANYFAGALLIPPIPLKKKLKEIHKEMNIRRNVGKIYLDNSASNTKDFLETLAKLVLFYNVSQTCMEIRLRQREHIIDKRITSGEMALTCNIENFFHND